MFAKVKNSKDLLESCIVHFKAKMYLLVFCESIFYDLLAWLFLFTLT